MELPQGAKACLVKARQALEGRTVKEIQYMGDQDIQACGWERRTVVITFDNGTILYAQSDDEGNDAGVLVFQSKDVDGILPIV